MSKYHPNVYKIIKIEDDAIFRLGWNEKYYGQKCFCETVARMSGEEGNDYPSDYAIRIANWLKRSLAG